MENDTLKTSFNVIVQGIDTAKNRPILLQDIEKYLNSVDCSYWVCKHDRDLTEEKTPKTLHYHIVIKFINGLRKRKTTLLNDLVSGLDCSIACLSVQPCSSVFSSIRYLIHKDNAEKFQYSWADIHTNDLDTMNVALAWSCKVLDTDTLISAIKFCGSDHLLLCQMIGLKNYCRYKNVIVEFEAMLWCRKNK